MGLLVRSRSLLALLALPSCWFTAASVHAATFVVSASEDEPDSAPGDGVCASIGGSCTLRAAVEETNATEGLDHIYLSTENYRLTRGPLVIEGQLEIAGREASWTTLDGNYASRVLELRPSAGAPGYLRLVGLTLANGFAGAPDPRGGAVLNDDPDSRVVMYRVVVRDNFAARSGGGVYNAGTLEVSRSDISANRSDPEAVAEPAAAGGGIYNTGFVVLSRSSLTDNAAVRGAGLANEAGSVSISNTTFGRNRARVLGGAISNGPGAPGAPPFTALSFSTVVDNQAGAEGGPPGQAGGIYNAGTLQLTSSIVARNADLHSADSPNYAPDCVSETPPALPADEVSVTSLGGMVWGVVTERCEHGAAPSDQRGAAGAPLDPGLTESMYSSPNEDTWGYQPLEDSIVVDAAVEAGGTSCIDQDLWGFGRPAAGRAEATPRCDSGAIELNGAYRRRAVMMIVGSQAFAPTDLILSVKLSDSEFDIVSEPASDLTGEILESIIRFALISETVTSSELPSWLSTIEKPILTLEPGALDELGMTHEGWDRTQGAELGASTVRLHAGGPIDLGFSGELVVTDGGAKLGWGVPATCDAFTVAELASAPGHWAVFGYEAGAKLADGSRAPAARVAFFAADGTPQRMNDDGWNLFAATLSYLVP